MRTIGTVTIGCVLVATMVATAAGCAASKSNAPPAVEPSAQGAGQAGYPGGGAAKLPYAESSQPAQAPAPPPPPPAPEPAPMTPATPSSPPNAGSTSPGGAQGRSMALQSASRDVEQFQRELDVAGSDCKNACRALGSMDRAAGRLCELSRGDGELGRCDDAKRRVYSARDRVRTTCGTCADGTTVERAAPIPSR